MRAPYLDDPWHYGKRGGRFDLPADEPHGSCYVALGMLAAIAEAGIRDAVTPERMVEASRFSAAAVRELQLPDDRDAADLCASAAFGYGVTRELSACDETNYFLTRRWATALHRHGHRAIHYELRHPADGWGLALFGPYDIPPGKRPPPGLLHPFDDQLLDAVARHYRVIIVDVGRVHEYTTVEDVDTLE